MILTNRSNIWSIIMDVSAGPAPHAPQCIAVLIVDITNILSCNYGKILCTLGGYKMCVEAATALVFLCKMWTHDPWNPSQRREFYSSNPERPIINEAAQSIIFIVVPCILMMSKFLFYQKNAPFIKHIRC